MLKMNCPNCTKLIKSPLLAEVQLFVCPHCEEVIVVNDVEISTDESPSPLFSSLKSLLLSSKRKFIHNKHNNLDYQAKDDIEKRLTVLLRRNDFRLKIAHDLLVQVIYDTDKISAKLINISSTGAAVEYFGHGEPLAVDSVIKFRLLLPEHSEAFSLLARVVWNRKPTDGTISPSVTLGIQFIDIDEKARMSLWDYIVNAEHQTTRE